MTNSELNPTFANFMQFLRDRLPTVQDAQAWVRFRLPGGPMTQEEYDSYKKLIGGNDDECSHLLRLRNRTAIGYYIHSWIQWFSLLSKTGWEAYISRLNSKTK